MKRKIILTILMVVFAMCSLGFIACGGEHEHNYTSNVVLPTEDALGYTEYICECGDSFKSDYVDKLAKSHTVSFECDFATIPSQQVSHGEKAVEPVVEGYEIEGYYLNNEKWSFKGYSVTEDITLTVNLKGTSSLSFAEETDGYCLIRYLGNNENVIIPKYLNGKPVITIGQEAFQGKSKVLKSVLIPDSVTSIGDYAFSFCGNLESITIPSSVTSIGKKAFSGCNNLESITVESNNANYSSQDGILYNKDKTQIIEVPQGISGSIVLPNTLTSIGSSAFFNCGNLKTVTFEENSKLENIGYSAFDGCIGLESITIPSSVTSIGGSAFYNCSKLMNVFFEDKTTWFIGFESDIDVSDATVSAVFLTEIYASRDWYKK